MSIQFRVLVAATSVAVAGGCREPNVVAAERVTHNVVAPEPPCRGCVVEVPPTRTGEMPLLVVLHGNDEHAADAMARWRDVAIERGWVVLALECPREDGCTDGAWYAWNGAPSWIEQQVSAIEARVPIDPSRRFVAGWSGGASYIGMNAHRWGNEFAAMVLHGGGQPPLGGVDDCPDPALPAYFLVGDGNPAHPAAIRLKKYLERCRQEVTWDLLPGAGHQAEAQALDHDKASAILDWLGTHAPAA